MSGFTKLSKFTTEFEGDTVTMSLKRLTRDQIKNVAHYITEEKGDIKISFSETLEMLEATKPFIEDCVVNFKGLNDADGHPLEWNEVVGETYFMNLVGNIFTEVMKISLVSEETAKKLDQPREEDSPLVTGHENSSSAA